MFEQSLLDVRGRTQKASSILISSLVQTGFLLVGVILPMIYFDTLPGVQLSSFLVPPPPPPPPPPPAPPPKVIKVIPRQFDANKLLAPRTIPKEIAVIKEDELPPPVTAGVVGGVPGGVSFGALGGIGDMIRAIPVAAPPPKVEEKKAPPPPQRIRVGGNVQQAKLKRQPKPLYPPLARQARIQGTVRFTAVIGKDGSIQNLQMVTGHPLLVQSAQDAVKQWLYEPTLLNGEAVEVITQIDVNFTLTQ